MQNPSASSQGAMSSACRIYLHGARPLGLITSRCEERLTWCASLYSVSRQPSLTGKYTLGTPLMCIALAYSGSLNTDLQNKAHALRSLFMR